MSERRGSAHSRGYDRKWHRARAIFLRSHPLCAMCAALGRVVTSTVVDHVTPHRGDKTLFWDHSNWQALCKPCHDRFKAQIERGTPRLGCSTDGTPVDANHHWAG